MSASDGNRQRSDSYDCADDLVRADWAYEALRRNPRFRKSRLEAQRNFEIIEQRDHLRVIGCFGDERALRRWGYLYTDRPDSSAPIATETRVDAEWNRGPHLFDRVRRAVKRGRHLMNGGYLKFFR